MLQEENDASIDPKRFAEAQKTLQGEIFLSHLNLPDLVLGESEGVVHYQLQFGLDRENYVYIQGNVETEMNLLCQRCLKPMLQPMKSEFCLSPVNSEEEALNLPERFDAFFLENGKLSLLRLVEEELILSLPITVFHPNGCESAVTH